MRAFSVLAAFIAAMLLASSSLAESHSAYTARKADGVERTDTFDCREKVHLLIDWTDLEAGEHTVEAYWYDPKNRQEEYTSHTFYAPAGTTNLWLKLKGARGSRLMKSFDPQHGYEDFIGWWSVVVYLDGEKFSEKRFMVYC